MQMPGREYIVEIEILITQFEHSAGIGQDEPVTRARQDHRQPGRRAARPSPDMRDIYTTGRNPAERHLSQRISPDLRDDAHARTEHG